MPTIVFADGKYSRRTERAAEWSLYASLQEGTAVNYTWIYLTVTLSTLQEKYGLGIERERERERERKRKREREEQTENN